MGSLVGSSVGASVGSLLVPGFGLLGSGAGEISLGGACAPPSACWGWSPVSPYLNLLEPATPCVVSSSTSGQSWLSLVSLPATSFCCCSRSALVPLENVAVAMPLGHCALLPHAVCLVLILCN